MAKFYVQYLKMYFSAASLAKFCLKSFHKILLHPELVYLYTQKNIYFIITLKLNTICPMKLVQIAQFLQSVYVLMKICHKSCNFLSDNTNNNFGNVCIKVCFNTRQMCFNDVWAISALLWVFSSISLRFQCFHYFHSPHTCISVLQNSFP